MTSEIIWKGSPDDMTARINDYVLRVEKIDHFNCWWGVSGEWEINFVSGMSINITEAKTACEKAYYEHLKTR